MDIKPKTVDDYIHLAEPFAQPVLIHLRNLVHTACPQVEEALKWGMPHFIYKTNLCAMASFKHHCSFMIHKAALIVASQDVLKPIGTSGMGNFGKIKSLSDLPSDEIILGLLQRAIELTDQGIELPKIKKSIQVPDLPEDFREALQERMEVYDQFESMAPSHRKEYIEWISDAKREATRQQRIATAVEWISQGKGRNWKYMK